MTTYILKHLIGGPDGKENFAMKTLKLLKSVAIPINVVWSSSILNSIASGNVYKAIPDIVGVMMEIHSSGEVENLSTMVYGEIEQLITNGVKTAAEAYKKEMIEVLNTEPCHLEEKHPQCKANAEKVFARELWGFAFKGKEKFEAAIGENYDALKREKDDRLEDAMTGALQLYTKEMTAVLHQESSMLEDKHPYFLANAEELLGERVPGVDENTIKKLKADIHDVFDELILERNSFDDAYDSRVRMGGVMGLAASGVVGVATGGVGLVAGLIGTAAFYTGLKR